MLLLLILFLLLCAVVLFGFVFLDRTCARKERAEGWEEVRVAASGNPVWQKLFREGKEWLSCCETEEVTVQSDDGWLLHGLLIPHIEPRATVLLFHGWRSSAEMDFTCILPFLHDQGLQCLLIDERAQGDSEGRWMTFGIRERQDVPVWVNDIANRFGREHPIFLHGLSMGATTVLMASSEHLEGNVRGIIADSGFTSPYEIISKVWRDRTPFPSRFAVWLLNRYTNLFADFDLKAYSTVEALQKAQYPVLFLHGAGDGFVPCYMTKQSYQACASEKVLLLVEGADHCMSYFVDRERVESAYRMFIDRLLP